jgi:hypothetical protein
MVRLLQELAENGDSDAAEKSHEMISLVVLYRDYVELTVELLLEILDEVFPGAFLPPGEINRVGELNADATFMVQSAVQGATGLFMLHNIPASYTEFSDFAQYIADPALLELVQATRAWLSVDLIVPGENERDDAYRFISRVIARLAPGDAAFLVHPASNSVIAFDEDIRRGLAEGRQLFKLR